MKFGDGPVFKNKLAILKKVYLLIYRRETKQTLFMLVFPIIWISECI